MDVVCQKGTVICLANTRNSARCKVHTKHGVLCHIYLKVICQFVQPVTVYSTLLNTKEVVDGTHEFLIPLTVRQSTSKSIIKINQALITCAGLKGIYDDVFFWDQVKSALRIQEKKEDRNFGRVEGKIKCFC